MSGWNFLGQHIRLEPLPSLLMGLSRCSVSCVCWERASKHGISALRLLLCGLVLNHVPMFDENSVFDPQNIRRDPIHRQADPREAPVNDDKISFSHDHARFILQRWRDAPDEVKQPVPPRCNVRTMLNVAGRPIPFGLHIIALIKKGVECFENQCFVSCLR